MKLKGTRKQKRHQLSFVLSGVKATLENVEKHKDLLLGDERTMLRLLRKDSRALVNRIKDNQTEEI